MSTLPNSTAAGTGGRWPKRIAVLGALLTPLIAAVAFAIVLTSSHAALAASPTALARLSLPVGGATVERVAATVGREQSDLPVKLVGSTVWPTSPVRAGQPVTVVAIVRRPGWNAWLTGATQRLTLHETTPRAQLADAYVTVKAHGTVPVRYREPVVAFGSRTTPGRISARALATPQRTLSVRPDASAGTLYVSAAARTWEVPSTAAVSWFPAGSTATAVADPAPGHALTPQSAITLTFSTPVAKALHHSLPAVTPAGSGHWVHVDSHTIRFQPSGYGYGLGAQVKVALPSGVHLIGGTGDPVGIWQVPTGSTTRLQQLLADLGYLPLTFTPSGPPVADTLTAQEAAAVTAPSGTFAWRYGDTPTALKAQWQPGSYDELTKAAVMAFENTEGLTTDGVDGPNVWKALIHAELTHQTNTFGYTFVFVHEADSGEYEQTWHDGKIVASGAVNTGTAAAGGTATGVFAVFEHLPSTTMTGTNPDGSTYSDPGIPDVSYFDGGDALHGYIRASYGFPQSDGCVEMPYAEAAQVYPWTPIGTVVDVSTGSN